MQQSTIHKAFNTQQVKNITSKGHASRASRIMKVECKVEDYQRQILCIIMSWPRFPDFLTTLCIYCDISNFHIFMSISNFQGLLDKKACPNLGNQTNHAFMSSLLQCTYVTCYYTQKFFMTQV